MVGAVDANGAAWGSPSVVADMGGISFQGEQQFQLRSVSGQPANSYKLVPANGHLELQITDVKEFRKFKQLVIMTL